MDTYFPWYTHQPHLFDSKTNTLRLEHQFTTLILLVTARKDIIKIEQPWENQYSIYIAKASTAWIERYVRHKKRQGQRYFHDNSDEPPILLPKDEARIWREENKTSAYASSEYRSEIFDVYSEDFSDPIPLPHYKWGTANSILKSASELYKILKSNTK